MSITAQIRFLGGFSIIKGDRSLSVAITPRLQSLIAYLLLHSDSPVSRQQLAYLFWPDSTDAQARANLRHLLHSLRSALPDAEQLIQFNQRAVQWRRQHPVWFDVWEFEQVVTQTESIGSLQNAIKLYAGDLLPDCYDDWVALERERLRQLYLAGLEKLVLLLETDREYDGAIRYARQLLQQDPLHEAVCRRLMRLHMLKGDRASALRVYHTCTTTLQRELNVGPGAAIQKAYRRLVNLVDTPPPSQARLASHIPLVGRKAEWSSLQAAWRGTPVGSPRLILISGEAGIGKTRLAEEMVDWARRQGIQASSANCFAVQRELAHVPLVSWLRSRELPPLDEIWLSEVARLLPELLVESPELSPPEPITEGWQRLRFFEALARAILGGSGTRILLLEDLQWCDAETLEFLHYLLNLNATRPGMADGRKIFLLGTLRIEEENGNGLLQELLITLRGQENLTEVLLLPLDESETTLLATSLTRSEISPEAAANLYRETEGNPLFVVETVQAELPNSLPAKIQAVIAARLARVSAAARKLAELASVIGRQFTFEILASASDLSEADLIRVLDELWQRRIIREQGKESYDFSHDKIREVIYDSLSSARRRWIHRRVGQALESVHQDALDAFYGKIGDHFELAGMPKQALSNYRRAFRSARKVYANREAVHFLQRCLVVLQSGDPTGGVSRETVIEIYESLGEVLGLMAKHAEARKAYQNAWSHLREADRTKKAGLERKIGNTWREQGDLEQANRNYQAAEALLATAPGSENTKWWQEYIQIKLEQMLAHYWLGQPDRIQEYLQEAQPVVERHGTQIQRADFYLMHTRMDLRRERYRLSEQTLARQRMATDLIEAAGSATNIAASRFGLGFTLLWSGNFREAEETLKSALALAEKTGDRQLQTRCLSYLTILYRMLGRNECVREYAERNLAAAVETDMPEYVFSARANQSWLAWREGEMEEAKSIAEQALTKSNQIRVVNYPFKWLALLPLLDIRLEEQCLDQALESAREILAPEQQRLPEALSTALEQSIADWESSDLESALEQLHGAVVLARHLGYL